MESQKPKIALYAKRSFGEKLTASFDFIKENWKILLKFTTYLLLPVCLVQALSMNGLMRETASASEIIGTSGYSNTGMLASYFSYYGLYMLVYMIGMILLVSMVYALIKTYNEREERLEGITLGMLWPLLFRNIKRLLIITLVGLLLLVSICIVAGVLVYQVPLLAILFVPLFFAVIVPLAIWAPIYLFEDISVVKSLQKTLRLGFATWGGIFLVSLVMGLIASILQGVTMMPWYIATLVKYIFAMSDTGSELTVSAGYNFILYLLGIIQAFGAYLAMIFTFIGMAYQYGHATEKMDNVTIESDIDNFDKL